MDILSNLFSFFAQQRKKQEVYTETDPTTGIGTSEAWHEGGKLSRADGPAVIERDAKTGVVTLESWGRDGKLGRADGPAVIRRDAATSKVTVAEWRKDGKPIAPPAPVLATAAASPQP